MERLPYAWLAAPVGSLRRNFHLIVKEMSRKGAELGDTFGLLWDFWHPCFFLPWE